MKLTKEERAAIKKLEFLAKSWPPSLYVHAFNSTSLSIHKNYDNNDGSKLVAQVDLLAHSK